jgi:hypothetical protein
MREEPVVPRDPRATPLIERVRLAHAEQFPHDKLGQSFEIDYATVMKRP